MSACCERRRYSRKQVRSVRTAIHSDFLLLLAARESQLVRASAGEKLVEKCSPETAKTFLPQPHCLRGRRARNVRRRFPGREAMGRELQGVPADLMSTTAGTSELSRVSNATWPPMLEGKFGNASGTRLMPGTR